MLNHEQQCAHGASNSASYDGPPPPLEGQEFIDALGGFWKVKRLTLATNPAGFYLVHLCFGPTRESIGDSMILGPASSLRSFATAT